MDIFRHIFNVIFIATSMIQTAEVSECPDCPCLEHTYNIGSKQFTWPNGTSSDAWIASNCMDQKKLLIFRKCMNGTWIPSNNVFQIICQRENIEYPSYDCPNDFHPIQIQGSLPRTICIREKGLQYDFITDWGVCIQDSIFTMELNNGDQTQLVERLNEKFANYSGLFVLGARWRYPCKLIHMYFNHEKEDVELQDVRCGRFGLPLKFNYTVPVNNNCPGLICTDLCLYVNTIEKPFSQLIDACNEYIIGRPTNSFLQEIGCPDGYYRTEYDYVESGIHEACFSIRMFPQPIPVKDVDKVNVIRTQCGGTMMTMNWGDDIFIFRQLSERLGLSEGNQCLFGLTSNRIVTFSDWSSSSTLQTPFFFNWDKSMNYSRIISPDTVSYLVVKPNGQWTWAIDTVSCIACMIYSPIPIAELHLEYNAIERQLVLTVTNQNFLYKEKSSDPGFICHFNYGDYGDIYKSNLTISRMSYSTYLIEDVGIGDYWCSGHNVINRLYIWNGKRIFAYGIWFVFEVVRKCSANCYFSTEDLNRFTIFFTQNTGLVKILNSAVARHTTPESDNEYTFTAYLSLTVTGNSKWLRESANNLMNLSHYQLETYWIYEQFHNAIAYEESREMNIKSIKSTEFCLNDKGSSIEAIVWRVALISETIPMSPLCSSQGNGSVITRKCSGNSVNGSFWDEAVDASHCYTFVSQSLLELYGNFTSSSQTSAVLESIELLLLGNIQTLLPLDVFLTSRILQKVSVVTFEDLQNIFSIYNTLMQIDESFLKLSASSNSTNILLEALGNILMIYVESSIISSSEYRNSGNFSIHSPFLETYIIDPVVSGASGVALYRPPNCSSESFSFYSSRYIYPNETIEDLITDGEGINVKDLVIGSYLPTDVLRDHKNITVVVTVFFNEKLFQTNHEVPLEKEMVKIYGKIITLKILGDDLPRKIPIVFESNQTDDASICGQWISSSEWSSIGCNVRQMFVINLHRLTVCECSLFTHFGYLIDYNIDETNEKLVSPYDTKLTIFSVAATSLSFIGPLVVFLTAIISKKWRRELSSKILIHFSAAISLETFVMMLITFDEQISTVIATTTLSCGALGSILQYSVLAMSFWTLIFIFIQFNSFITIFNFKVSHLWPKFITFGWVTPLLPVITVLLADRSLYVSIKNDEVKFCYPTGYVLYLGIVAPMALIYLTNVIVLILVSISIHRRLNSSVADVPNLKITLTQIFASAFLFIDLNLAGIFVFLSKSDPNLLFLYIFYVTASFQGPSLLLNLIVFNMNFIAFIFHSFSLFISNKWAHIILKVNMILFGEYLYDV